jgi:hypothetical protein
VARRGAEDAKRDQRGTGSVGARSGRVAAGACAARRGRARERGAYGRRKEKSSALPSGPARQRHRDGAGLVGARWAEAQVEVAAQAAVKEEGREGKDWAGAGDGVLAQGKIEPKLSYVHSVD